MKLLLSVFAIFAICYSATVMLLSSGQQKDLEGKSHSIVWVRSFSQHLLPDHKKKTWLLQQIRNPLTLDIYEINEDTAFAKSYRNYLDPAYETMKNYGVGFEMVLYASLFLPFIHFYLWKLNWTRCSCCKKRRWPCW